MRIRTLAGAAFAVLMTAASMTSLNVRLEAQGKRGLTSRNAGLPEGATRCDPSLPILIDLVPLNAPEVGQTARFGVRVESSLDPDLIKRSRVEYETPSRMRRITDAEEEREILGPQGRGRAELKLVVPDKKRYEIRARLIVQLVTGQTISQTAVRWIDLGEEDPPEGMIDRIAGPDGTGIRVYQGQTVRN